MKVLLTRFGGIGDCFPVMVAARELVSRGNDVTVALRDDGGRVKQMKMFENYKEFKFLNFCEYGPWRDRVVEHSLGKVSIQAIYKDYDLVIDYMNCIENNSTSPHASKDIWEWWQRSRSSNYANWYDLHLAWAGIDPTKVSDGEKRPFLKLTDEEIAKSLEFKSKYTKVFLIHPFASSLARSWYQAKELPQKLVEKYKGCAVCFWNPKDNNWDLITSTSLKKVEKLSEDPLRDTMILINASNLVLSVDTGCSHMAEALDKKSLVIYSTVPHWTRNQYYSFQEHIDMGEKDPSFYTFSLGLGDPLRIKDGLNNLTEREKKIKELWDKNASPQEAMNVLNTDNEGAELELKLLMGKQETWERQQSKSLSSVTVDMVFQRIKRIIG